MTKIKWQVSSAPTGAYRSFQRRAWPAGYDGEDVAFHIYCEDDYSGARVKTGDHRELKITFTDRSVASEVNGAWVWRTLKKRAASLNEAKAIAQDFYNKNQHYFITPESYTK